MAEHFANMIAFLVLYSLFAVSFCVFCAFSWLLLLEVLLFQLRQGIVTLMLFEGFSEAMAA
jgi:hypothetical protein